MRVSLCKQRWWVGFSCTIIMVALLATTATVFATPAPLADIAADANLFLAEGSQVADDTITVTSHVVLAENGEQAAEGVWLAGLATEHLGAPSVLAVTWAPVDSGWFGSAWGVQLQSSKGLLTDKLSPKSGSGFLAGSSYIPYGLSLEWGHEYATTLSYNKRSGALSVVVTDTTADKVVISDGYQAAPYSGFLYPAVGVRSTGAHTPQTVATVKAFAADSRFIPAGVRWQLVQRGSSAEPFTYAPYVDRSKDTALKIEFPWAPPAGSVRVVGEVAGTQVSAQADLYGTSLVVPITVAKLPVGDLHVQPNLNIDGRTWPLAAIDVRVGNVELKLANVQAKSVDDGLTALEGQLVVQTDGLFPGARVKLTSDLIEQVGSQLKVKADDVVVLDQAINGAGQSVVPFRLQQSTPINADAPSEWLASLKATVESATIDVSPVEGKWVVASLPRQVVLTWQDDPKTTMTITWRSDMVAPDAAVYYSADSKLPISDYATAAATPFTFAQSKAQLYSVQLTGLKPGTEYTAVIKTGGFTLAPFKFETLPVVAEDMHFVVGGDTRTNRNERRAITQMAAADDPMFIVLTGDLVEKADEKLWDDWFDDWHELAITKDGRRIPILPAVGNHEVINSSKTKAAAPYYYGRFVLPGEEAYYSLDLGPNLGFITLDTNHTTLMAGKQTTWLEEQLKGFVNKPWLIVQYHVAAWPSVRGFDEPDQKQIRNNWIPLFEKYGVDLGIEAHDHAYKKTQPIFANKIDTEKGIVYIGDGAWGAPLRDNKKAADYWWLAESSKDYHYWRVTLGKNAEQLKVEPVFYKSIGTPGTPTILERTPERKAVPALVPAQ